MLNRDKACNRHTQQSEACNRHTQQSEASNRHTQQSEASNRHTQQSEFTVKHLSRIILPVLLIGSLVFGKVPAGGEWAAVADRGHSQAAVADQRFTGFAENSVAPNEGAIAKSLILQGRIRPNASQGEIDEAVDQYLKAKLKTKPEAAAANKKARVAAAKSMTSVMTGFQNFVENRKFGAKPGQDESISDVKTQPYPKRPQEGKLLVLLAQFKSDPANLESPDNGPLYSNFPVPGSLDNSTMYVTNYGTDYYDQLLFSKGGFTAIDQNNATLKLNSMNDYFLEQSYGKYGIKGDTYGWYTLPHSEAYYGDDSPLGGNDNNDPGTAKDLVTDLMDIVAKDRSINLSDYDLEDPYDLDGDGKYNEPDGIIDHLVIMHAGIDQSAGGGLQGDGAIWAHSSSVNYTVHTKNGNFTAMNYTIQGQDSGIGTFCHEYGHDLGLPDEYDTNYTGSGEPVGFWSIMSSGSWLGQPLDSKPSSFSPWARFALGWTTPVEVDSKLLTKTGTSFDIDQAVSLGVNATSVKVNLPDQTIRIANPYQGTRIWYGGRGDELDNTLRIPLKLPVAAAINLNFALMYDIEANWDFGFVQVSTNAGITWNSLASTRTTSAIDPDGMPAIKANLPGYTGSSGGWVNESLNLTPYAGKDILLRMRYMTDWGTNNTGMFVDSIQVTADGAVLFADDGENGTGAWVSIGWSLMNGTEQKGHYYMLEWRAHNGSDATLANCYTFVDSVNGTVDFYRNQPGLVVWYRNKVFTENWVGDHPGFGFLGVVDAHPAPVVYKGKPLRTRLQIRDAAFGLTSIESKTFVIGKDLIKLPALPAVSSFYDGNAYWFRSVPDAGLKLPAYGLKFTVVEQSPNRTAGRVLISK